MDASWLNYSGSREKSDCTMAKCGEWCRTYFGIAIENSGKTTALTQISTMHMHLSDVMLISGYICMTLYL